MASSTRTRSRCAPLLACLLATRPNALPPLVPSCCPLVSFVLHSCPLPCTHPPSPHHTHTQRHTPPTTTQVADESPVVLNGFGTVVNALGQRAKPYLPQICGTIKWRLNNKSAKIRQQAAELISRIAPVMVKCEEEKLLAHLGVVLYENLGEEYPGQGVGWGGVWRA